VGERKAAPLPVGPLSPSSRAGRSPVCASAASSDVEGESGRENNYVPPSLRFALANLQRPRCVLRFQNNRLAE
jgi:hypothetical protein